MDFAIYKGDEFLFVGTKYECAAYMGMRAEDIQYYSTPAMFKRNSAKENAIIIIRLERNDDD